MFTAFLRKKAARQFELFDADGNGLLQRDDLDRVTGNLATAVGIYVGSNEYSSIQARYSALWEIIEDLDVDQDGKVTLDEWFSALERISQADEDYDLTFGRMAEVLFHLFDTDQDGFISPFEFTSWLTAHGVSPTDAEKSFSAISKDGGSISRGRMLQLTSDFIRSDDPSKEGNMLFGPI